MATIMNSVGDSGKNNFSDVIVIQKLININLDLISPEINIHLNEDGKMGPKTISAIKMFQTKVIKMQRPDKRIDPGGRTIKALIQKKDIIRFPLMTRPSTSYKEGMRRFGANRSNGRRHAGCDLYKNIGAEIVAMKDGVVVRDAYPFYLSTYALEIDHGTFVARYGEIYSVARGIRRNARVKRGQLIAYVGQLKFKSGNTMSMLHLELYSGKAKGALTNRAATPYQRRSDLIDPTAYLDKGCFRKPL